MFLTQSAAGGYYPTCTIPCNWRSWISSPMGIALQSEMTVSAKGRRGFTLMELMIVIAIIAILSSILLPALSRAKSKAQAILCLNHTKQLTMAWMIYADDHNGLLAYNLGSGSTNIPMSLNWV